MVLLPLVVVGYVFLAISGSTWHAVLAAFFAVMLAAGLRRTRRIRRRVDLLHPIRDSLVGSNMCSIECR